MFEVCVYPRLLDLVSAVSVGVILTVVVKGLFVLFKLIIKHLSCLFCGCLCNLQSDKLRHIVYAPK